MFETEITPETASGSSARGRSKFTPQEDRALQSLVAEHGPRDWSLIASYLQGRNPRQCKERWTNYLCPEVRDTPWTLEEDLLLVQKQREFGCKWVQIAKFFPNRTDAMIKNRFNRLRRRQHKEIQTFARQDPKQFQIFQSWATSPMLDAAITTDPIQMAPYAQIEPRLPETRELPAWNDVFSLDDCFVDPFAWI
jgi:hypothetical protein